VREAAEQVSMSAFHAWLLMDEGGVVGVLSRTMLENAFANGKADESLLSLLDSLDFPHVHADHALHLALERMSSAHVDILPVVNRANVHKLEGVVTLKDVLDSYGVDPRGSA
ncbi:MAG TPA: CBS domain-containing protein, partial [Candidatus Angelobacter sp.]|nr:CBS domain-containing protein [Candidatus Angelobacter sp.]